MSTDSMNSIKSEQDEKPSNLQKLLHYGCLEMVQVPSKCTEKRANFTIDYILGTNDKQDQNLNAIETHYDWLHYTRYRPPKLQSKFLLIFI